MNDSRAQLIATAAAFRRAVEVVGGQVKAAKICNRTQGAVSKRLAAGLACWPDSILPMEAATAAEGKMVHRSELDPILYPPAEYQTPGVRPGVASADHVSPRAADAPSSAPLAEDPASGELSPKRAA